MNNNQVSKGLLRAGNSYKNSEKYDKLVKNAKLIKLSFADLINDSALAADYTKLVKTTPIVLPFDNILFDITGYPISSMATGNVANENFAIHLQPYAVRLKEHNLITMVVTDIRLERKLMMSRSYVMYADQAGLHTMTTVDKASDAVGCHCHRSNVFSADPAHSNAFSDVLPCFSMDVGLALPDCTGSKPGCAPVIACRQEISKIVKILLAYANLPSNFFVQVTVKGKKHNEKYYIVCDMVQWEALKNGNESAELLGNDFRDGSKLLMAMNLPQVKLPTEILTIGNKTYVPLARDNDEARPSSESGKESDVGSGASVDSSLS